jgi:hypothetical protein
VRGAYDGPTEGTIDGFVLGDADGTIEADAVGDGAGVINGVTVGNGEICVATELDPVAPVVGLGPSDTTMAAHIAVAPATAGRIDWRLMTAGAPLNASRAAIFFYPQSLVPKAARSSN